VPTTENRQITQKMISAQTSDNWSHLYRGTAWAVSSLSHSFIYSRTHCESLWSKAFALKVL